MKYLLMNDTWNIYVHNIQQIMNAFYYRYIVLLTYSYASGVVSPICCEVNFYSEYEYNTNISFASLHAELIEDYCKSVSVRCIASVQVSELEIFTLMLLYRPW